MARIAHMSVRVMGPDDAPDDINQEVNDGLNWSQVEDSINDQLPDGYYCKVEDA